ncbi:MAG: LPS translocon maturation chaperone LptM [Salinarimonas sp.]
MTLISPGGRAVLVAAAIVLTIAACGRRGPPEAPPAAADRPMIESEQQDESRDVTGPARPDRPFVLDALL